MKIILAIIISCLGAYIGLRIFTEPIFVWLSAIITMTVVDIMLNY